MADVQFSEPQYVKVRPPKQKGSGLTQLVIKLGLAKSTTGAQVVLLTIALLAFALMVAILTSGNPSSAPVQAVPVSNSGVQ